MAIAHVHCAAKKNSSVQGLLDRQNQVEHRCVYFFVGVRKDIYIYILYGQSYGGVYV